MKWIKICGNKIDDYDVELYTNNLKNSYQLINITNVISGSYRKTPVVAPVDFYTMCTAIVFSETIDEFTDAIVGCWNDEKIKSIIKDLENDLALKISDAELDAENELAKSFDVYFDDE